MYVQKLEQEKLAKERGEVKDNRSFIAKYVSDIHFHPFGLYIYLLTLFLFIVDVHPASCPRFHDVRSG